MAYFEIGCVYNRRKDIPVCVNKTETVPPLKLVYMIG